MLKEERSRKKFRRGIRRSAPKGAPIQPPRPFPSTLIPILPHRSNAIRFPNPQRPAKRRNLQQCVAGKGNRELRPPNKDNKKQLNASSEDNKRSRPKVQASVRQGRPRQRVWPRRKEHNKNARSAQSAAGKVCRRRRTAPGAVSNSGRGGTRTTVSPTPVPCNRLRRPTTTPVDATRLAYTRTPSFSPFLPSFRPFSRE